MTVDPSFSRRDASDSDSPIDRETIRKGATPARWYSAVDSESNQKTHFSEQNSYFERKSIRPTYSFASTSFQRVDGAPTASDKSDLASKLATSAPLNSNLSSSPSAATVVECELCPRRCRIAPGKTGFCTARVNDGGVLRTRFYGRPSALAIDPIEKKPLYHFLPGTPILSLGTFGCNLSCRFCQNWRLSQGLSIGETPGEIVEPRQIVETALARGCPSVAFTYNEPTIWAEYVVDAAKLCRQAGIKTVAVTNGMISGRAREEFFNAVDAANVDLKAFTPAFYRDLTGGSFDAVRETLEYVAKNTNVWLEITTLLIPTKNDSDDEIKRLVDWIAQTLGTEIPLHFSAFFPTYRLTDVPPTPSGTLRVAARIARNAGIRYVYCGNVDDKENYSTQCPRCGALLIERSARFVSNVRPMLTRPDNIALKNDESARFQRICANCEEKIAGVFE